LELITKNIDHSSPPSLCRFIFPPTARGGRKTFPRGRCRGRPERAHTRLMVQVDLSLANFLHRSSRSDPEDARNMAFGEGLHNAHSQNQCLVGQKSVLRGRRFAQSCHEIARGCCSGEAPLPPPIPTDVIWAASSLLKAAFSSRDLLGSFN